MKAFKHVVGSFVVSAVCGLSASAAPIFEKEIACYNALIGSSFGANYNLGEDLILLAATRSGKQGFYLYTEGNACFHAFPTAPAKRGMSYYYLELRVPGKKPRYVTYSYDAERPGNPGVAFSDDPAPELRGKYKVLSGGDALDEASKQAFAKDLEARVRTVASTYEQYLDDAQRMHRPAKRRKDYDTALDLCGIVDGKSLRSAVANERALLERASASIGGGASSREEGREAERVH